MDEWIFEMWYTHAMDDLNIFEESRSVILLNMVQFVFV